MNIKINKFNQVNPYIWLALILISALVIRSYFFLGLVNSDPEDDQIYMQAIKEIVVGEYNLGDYRGLQAQEFVSPVHALRLRIGFLYPDAFFVATLGYYEISYVILQLICSISMIALTYCFGRFILKNEFIGLLGAALLAFYPLDINLSTRILPEEPLALLISLSIFMFCLYLTQPKPNIFLMILSGIFAGLAHLIKFLGLILGPTLIIIGLLYFKKDLKKVFRGAFLFVIGLMIIIAPSEILFYQHSGTFFLIPKIADKAQLYNFKYFYTPVYTNITGALSIITFESEPLEYTKQTLNIKSLAPGINYFGYYFIFGISALVFLIYFNLKSGSQKHGTSWWYPAAWFVAGMGFLSLSAYWINISLIPRVHIDWWLIQKQVRYLSYVSIPLVLIIAAALYELRKTKAIFYGALAVLVVSSMIFTYNNTEYLRDGLKDVRMVSAHINDFKGKIFADHFAVDQINYFTHYKYTARIRILENNYNLEDVKSANILLGGARGVKIDGEEPMRLAPDFLRIIVADGTSKWKQVFEFNDSITNYRKYPLRVYYIP